ncbi:phosphoribosylformylglycinamidine synthase subunit PurS [Brevundimonas sp.]|uniref:phosphoribosylformylglycinamidine synthase subunit PurS n=1 Tax=Brevundimonas sp. TaxID=1871086 RepID=UPI002605081C|nr:phosphoribosylformylglycinamidine synthase subunit PurS [Brevundimonas sp.]
MAKVKVHVFLKPGVLDVQGKAVEGALKGLGWAGVTDARVGKLIEFDLDGVEDPAAEAKKMCETLLANTVIESYRVEVA